MLIDTVLKDVEVCGMKTFKISNLAQPMEWEEFGLSHFPQKNSLPKGIDKVTINIQASIRGFSLSQCCVLATV